MLEIIFYLDNEIILVRINGKKITFASPQFGAKEADIDGLKLDYAGVCREFPDLELAKDWREQSIQRFKSKIALMNSEEEIAEYIINDLRKFGYVPKYKQKQGFRIQKIE